MDYEQMTFAMLEVDTDYLETALKFGSNTRDARLKIVSEYSKGKTSLDFLRKIYHGCYGLKDGQISVQYDEKVIVGAERYTWQEVDEKIKKMLNDGTFATQEEIDKAIEHEYKELAEAIVYVWRDTEKEYDWDFLRYGSFPDCVDMMKNELKANSVKIKNKLIELKGLQEKGYEPIRFAKLYDLDDLISRVSDLRLPRIKFISRIDYQEEPELFITETEIDRALCRGSGISEGKKRIVEYFRANKNSEDRQEFLKKEYGIGGHSHALSGADHSGENHDAKGIQFHKSECKVCLNWSQIEKRIDKLIQKGLYNAEN